MITLLVISVITSVVVEKTFQLPNCLKMLMKKNTHIRVDGRCEEASQAPIKITEKHIKSK